MSSEMTLYVYVVKIKIFYVIIPIYKMGNQIL